MEELMAKDLRRAKFVKKERDERAWTQAHLAKVAEVSHRTIQRLERDGSASFETLMAVANAFEIEVKELTPTSSRSKEKTNPEKKVHLLTRIYSGKNVANLIDSAEEYQIVHDGANDEKTVKVMRSILENFRDNMNKWYFAKDSIQRIEIESAFSWGIQKIEALGFSLFGTKRTVQRIVENKRIDVSMSTVFMTYTNSPRIVRDKKLNMVVPALLSELVK